MKRYKCIREVVVDLYDDNGFCIENEEKTIEIGSVWEIKEGLSIIGGEVQLEGLGKNIYEWLEIDKETFENDFVEVENE